jgi:hypothetical protein
MSRATEYADGDRAFAEWLEDVDVLVRARVPLELFDLEDMALRESFDAGDTPADCLRDVVVESVRECYGDEYAELLVAEADE